jgi:tripartite-type tricarboxylate transporter receptor subunit TctC
MKFLNCWIVAMAALCSFSVTAQPDHRVVKIIVPAPPGGSYDGTARILAQRMSEVTGEPHVVENKPGANTAIGVEYVVRAVADGRTLVLAGTGMVVNSLTQKMSFSPADLQPVIAIGFERYALLGSSKLQITSGKGLEKAAAARPGGLNCAAPPGAMGLGCEQLKSRLNGAVTPVPFPGVAPALQALAGGHVDLAIVPLEQAGKLVDAKAANVLAVSDRTGSGELASSETPLFTDIWPGFVMDSVTGLFVPARTPGTRVQQLNRALAKVLSEPDTKKRLQDLGQEPAAPDSPESFGVALANLTARYAQVVRKLGLSIR